jgi:hypothetical protein
MILKIFSPKKNEEKIGDFDSNYVQQLIQTYLHRNHFFFFLPTSQSFIIACLKKELRDVN